MSPKDVSEIVSPVSDKARTVSATKLPRLFLMIESLQTGGSERQFHQLAGLVDREKFEVDLGCIRPQGPFLDDLGEVKRFPLGGSLYGWQSWRTRVDLARHLRENRVAIAHAFDFYSNLTLLPAARWAGVQVVVGSQRQLGDLLSPRQRRAQAAAFRFCDAVVCNSRAAAERLLAEPLAPRRVEVIGNIVPNTAFEPHSPALLRNPGILRVGIVGRMNAECKNHRLFLLMAARLREHSPAVEFLLVGDGPLRPKLERDAEKLGIGGQVRFLGDRRDIPALFASMDVSVVPSVSESLSNVILESMAAGVPVVATRVGGNSELLNPDRGVLVPSGDGGALAEAVKNLLAQPQLRQRMAENARSFAFEHFSQDRVLAVYQDLYEELLERKSVRSGKSGPKAIKPRVAIVAPTLAYVGGQAVQADLLMRSWRSDPDLSVKFIAVDPSFPPGLKWAKRIPFLRTIVREPIYLLKLWQGLKDADIAHIFSASYWSFLIAPLPALLISGLLGKKTVVNYHSGEARDHLHRFRTAKSILQRADRIVVPSGYLVDVFREFGLEAQPIANIVDLEQFHFRERMPLRPNLVSTRGFHAYYCPEIVVKAFAQVKKEYSEARLELAGGGPLTAEVRTLVEELGLEGVTFSGVVPRNEIGASYDRGDIFINASRLDNMPVSVLEAFASGTPVVSTCPEGMDYFVEHERTGLLSPPGDTAALAANVLRLLKEPDLGRRIAQNAYEESRRYHWTAIRQQWLKTYRSLLGSDSTGERAGFASPK